tara:strand:+ start:89 stop:430 length:342 start_codon:yes stop_codon:yes gene_type:complete
MPNLKFKDLVKKTNKVIKKFEKVEQRKWGIEGNMIELTKQVGELARNIMMLENYYLSERKKDPNYNRASKSEVANELSDILFMIIRIANHYKIDLEKAHLKELNLALKSLEKK